MNEFLQRLRERKLVQWALAYLAGAWVLLQVVGLIGQQFDWPAGLLRGITVAAGVGFFVTLVLAWYHGERGVQKVSGTELLLLALLLGIGGGLLWKFVPTAGPETIAGGRVGARGASMQENGRDSVSMRAPVSDKSVAVLPFANLSDEKANAYFADGMQDEVLTKLSKIGALRVTSRTSTQRYASAPENLAEVGRQLGVAHILEGSVQRSGNAVHINVQLIRAASDEHVWAESYNRTLDDVFGVQGEVAQAVAEALRATLTGAEREALAARGTENPRAYEAYLRGRAADRSGYSNALLIGAIDAYYAAVREDPAFVQAWSALAVAMSGLYQNGYDSGRSTAAAVREAADTAMRLQPELAESLLARGAYVYRVQHDYAGAIELYRRALAKQPGDVDILAELMFVERRAGRWDDAIAHYREAIARDPRNVSVLVQGACEIYYWLRRYDDARALLEHALAITPDDITARACLAQVEQRLGRLDAADVWLARVPRDSRDYNDRLARIDQLAYTRRYDELEALMAPALQGEDAALTNVDLVGLIRLGYAQRGAGKDALARRTFERLKHAIESRPGGIEHVVAAAPVTPLVFAALGDGARALATAQRMIELNRNDTLELADAMTVLAQVHAQQGHRDASIALLPELLAMPAGITPALLALDPMWDSIRDDPRFVAFTKQPVTEYKVPPHG